MESLINVLIERIKCTIKEEFNRIIKNNSEEQTKITGSNG